MGSKKQVSCFNGKGKLTPEIRQVFGIASTIQLAIYLNPHKPILTVMVETAKRMRNSPQYRSQWQQDLLKKYIKGGSEVVVGHNDTMVGYWHLINSGIKVHR